MSPPHVLTIWWTSRPTGCWDPLASLEHPNKFQRVSRLGSVAARHSSSGRQPKLCDVEQRASPTFGRAAITLGIGAHSTVQLKFSNEEPVMRYCKPSNYAFITSHRSFTIIPNLCCVSGQAVSSDGWLIDWHLMTPSTQIWSYCVFTVTDYSEIKLAATLRGSRPGVQSASLTMTSLMTS